MNKFARENIHMLSLGIIAAAGLAVPSTLLPGTCWALSLDVGRHEGVGTWMPTEWASSGKRLRISGIKVEFSDEVCTTEFNERRLNGLGEQEDHFWVRVLSSGAIVAADGDNVQVAVTSGGWSRVWMGREGAKEYRLRFFLDLADGATRGDVELPAGERVFFTTDGPLAAVGMASRLGVGKSGQLNVKRVRSFMEALSNMGSSPKLQWGEAMYTVGLFSMSPIGSVELEAQATPAEFRNQD